MRAILIFVLRVITALAAVVVMGFVGAELLSAIYQTFKFDLGKVGVMAVVGATLGAAAWVWQYTERWFRASPAVRE